MMISLAFLFVIFFYFNYYTPLFPSDDYVYTYIWQYTNLFEPIPETAVKIASWADWYISLSNHYMTWCGRLTNHALAMFFLWKDKIIFDVCNAFVSVLLIYLLVVIANKGNFKQIRNQYVLLAFIFLWVFQICWGNVFIWIEGSTNYLWSCTFLLLFLLPYIYNYYNGLDIKKIQRLYCEYPLVLFFLFSCVAGCTNENLITTVLFLLGLYLLYQFRQKEMQSWQIVGYVGLLIGYLVMMLAPGNQNRLLCQVASYASTGDRIYVYKPLLEALQNGKNYLMCISKELILLNLDTFLAVFVFQIFLWGFIVLYYIELFRDKRNQVSASIYMLLDSISKKDKHMITIFVLGAIIAEGMMLFSPFFVFRSAFFSLNFLIIASLILIRNKFHSVLSNYLLYKICYGYISIVFIVSFVASLFYFPISSFERTEWIENIKQYDVEHPYEIMVVEPHDKDSLLSSLSLFHCAVFYINDKEDSWENISFKVYHHLTGKIRRPRIEDAKELEELTDIENEETPWWQINTYKF